MKDKCPRNLSGCDCPLQLSEDHKVLKLADFGIARATEGTEQTKTMARGAYRYMAPEVAMARRGHYSKKADVYSFGESSDIRWNGNFESIPLWIQNPRILSLLETDLDFKNSISNKIWQQTF